MDNQLHSLNTNNSEKQLNKTPKFLENTKRAVRKALTTTGIVAGSMGPVTTPSVVPASINTITAVTPIASTAIKTIGFGTAAGLFAACGGGEDGPDGPIDTKDTIAPTININQNEVDITGGKQVCINGNQLYIGDILVASRNDNKSKNCKVELSLNGKSITSGTLINEGGTLTIKVTDAAGNSKNIDIKLTVQQDISGLENLQNLNMQVDQEVNLLNGVTFGNGAELIKTEIEIDGEKVVISDPNHYIPEYPGTCSIILTIKDKNGETKEYKVDNLTIKALEYKSMEINNIKPVDILPIIGQVEAGDKQVYEHIEHLRVAETTRIRDMMREYGAGNYSAEEYKQLMNRLNTGMTFEYPAGYDNYEIIEGEMGGTPDDHAHAERHILNTLVNHTNFKILGYDPSRERYDAMISYLQKNPNSIIIFGNSAYSTADNKQEFKEFKEFNSKIKDLCKSKNFIIFAAGTNLTTKKNKIYNGEYKADEKGMYSLASLSNSDKNTQPNTHLLVTIATNEDGDIDQTNVDRESSKYPVGFANNVLFSGRGFPQHREGVIYGPSGRYTTSDTNYLNVALADLCFQIKADVSDVDELLEMIKSTCLTDYIRLDGKTQELQLINPAGLFKKYLMPNNLPNNLESNKTINLNKGYYKGVIFDIPGAEVKINGEWIAHNDANKSLIKNQNPMTLEWRLNGDLCKKLGYQGKSINGKIIVVDDKRNGLNIDKELSINIQ